MKKIFNLLISLLVSLPLFSQNLQFEPGKKYVSEDGLISYSSEPSLLKILNPMVYMNLVLREGASENEYFVVISLNTKTLDKVSEDSSLQLNLSNGNTLDLPVNEKVVWDASKAPAKKSTEIYLINIPYRITKEQIDLISSTSVSKITLPGIEKNITFSVKGATMSNVMKRQFQEVCNLAQGEAQTNLSGNNTLAQSGRTKSSQAAGSEIIIHETPATKIISVQNLKNMVFYPVREDAFFVYEKGTGQTFIFNKKGEQLAKISLSYHEPHHQVNPFGFSNDRALIKFSDGNMVIIDSRGNVVNDLNKVDNLVTSEEYSQFNDGLALVYIADKNRDRMNEVLTGYIRGDYYYLDDNGRIVRPDLPVKVDVMGSNRFAHPLKDGRRLHCDAKSGKYGYLDAQHKNAIPIQYESACDFSEGLAAAAIKRGYEVLWGFIDTSGNWVIEPKFSNQPQDFHEGYTIVRKKNGLYVYIDKNGQVCSKEYKGAFRFFNGTAMVFVEAYNIKEGPRRLINKTFEEMPFKGPSIHEHSAIEYDENTKTIYYHGCVYSADGELLTKATDPFYTDVTVYYENGRPKGYVNIQGEIILKFVESEF